MKQLFVCLLLLTAAASEGQTFSRYIIKFKNKATTPFGFNNPIQFLSQPAIDRRTRYGIAIDSTDLPVTPRYLDSVRSAGAVTILNVSRWLNQVSIQTSDATALSRINALPFVESAKPIANRQSSGRQSNGTQSHPVKDQLPTHQEYRPTADFYNYGASYQQVHIHNGEFLHNIGLRGQGIVIGMLDGGFFQYTNLRAFDSVNRNGQVLGTHDFVARETSVTEDDSHGMQCFSVIAANIPSEFVGTAPKAGFYLFRTEDVSSEFPIEEHNWVCGAERLDSSGGDMISSSLGYSDGMTFAQFNHTYAEMNGNTTIAAIGADLAAQKGILVINSAGNQGSDAFRYIATPADGDSVVAVGAVNANGQVVNFSSYGPSSDGQVKPDVASVGLNTTVQTTFNTVGTNNGTSFAAPNIAGLTACLWQGFREFSNMKIIRALRLAGHKALAPDDRVGYGIPDVKKAVLLLLNEFSTASLTASSCKNTIHWTSKDITGMKYEVERKAPGETSFTKIGEKAATGTSFSAQSYQLADSLINIQAGTLTYRIRQIIDPAFSTASSADYIDTVMMTLAASCITTSIPGIATPMEEYLIVPNPANNTVSFQITTPFAVSSLTFQMIDSKGNIITTHKTNKGPGKASFDFPVSHLSSGKYYLAVFKDNTRLATRDFMKL